jgi:phage-related protein
MSLTITDYEGNVYTFPVNFETLPSLDFEQSRNVVDYSYFPGGKDVSDGFPVSRTVTVNGVLQADTAALYETAKRALVAAILKGGYLKRVDDVVDRYIEVKGGSITENFTTPEQLADIEIRFLAEFPFWEDSTETTDSQVMAGNGSFTVDGSGSDYIMFPKIEIEADQGVSVPAIKLKNNDDGGMYFEHADTGFIAGAILIIDSREGTVKLNNNDNMAYFVTPRFLRLQPKVNNFIYEGAAATVRVKYRKYYL